jgi:3-oxoacyl-[acyl-carrier protein] reductase
MLVDHANPSVVEKAADALVARIGAVHIVVVNTGAPEAGYLIDASTEEIDKCVAQLLSTAHKLAQVTAPGMRAAKYGRIIVVGSTSIERPIRGQGVSNVARAAMANWTRTLAGELGGFAITANLIMPGSTRTQRLESIIAGRAKRSGSSVEEVENSMIGKIPAGRFASPQEIGAVIAFIASPAAAYVNGALIPVDGGMLCMQS